MHRRLALDDGNHAGFANAGVHFVHAAQLECLHHPTGGVGFFKTQFRMGMQVVAKRGQFGMEPGNLGKRTATDPQLPDGTGSNSVCQVAEQRR